MNDFKNFVKSKSVSIALLKILKQQEFFGDSEKEELEYYGIIDKELKRRLIKNIEGF